MTTPNKKSIAPLSNKTIVDTKRVTDITSRLFRRIAEQMEIDVSSWKTYIDDYIRELHPDDPSRMDAVKKERGTAIGNINDTLWMSTKLSFNKMVTGFRILKIRKMTVILKVETESGKEYVVEETTNITNKR